MMTSKQFNRVVRALTLVYEALSLLWLSAFFEWCRENDILAALKDKLSPVLASPRFFRINYCLLKCLIQLHTRKIQSTDLSIHHHPKVYQLPQQSTTLYESLLSGEYEF
jgi:hypothetical protein